MEKEKEYCEERNQDVVLSLDFSWIDKSIGVKIPTRIICPYQDSCEVFLKLKIDGFCPTMERVHKKYTSRLGPTS
jgi:hypothetical protein